MGNLTVYWGGLLDEGNKEQLAGHSEDRCAEYQTETAQDYVCIIILSDVCKCCELIMVTFGG